MIPAASMMNVPRRAIPLTSIENAVRRGHRAMRPEVRQQVKAIAFLFGVGAQREFTVNGNGKDRGVRILELRKVVADFT